MKSNGSEAEQNGGTLGFSVDSELGLTIKPTLTSAYSDKSGGNTTSVTSLSSGANLTAAIEIWHFILGNNYNDKAPFSILAGGGAGYAGGWKHGSDATGLPLTYGVDTSQYAGLLSFNARVVRDYKEARIADAHVPFGGVLLVLTPQYQSINTHNAGVGFVSATNSVAGTFALDTQVRYLFAPTANALVFGRWYHDTNKEMSPGTLPPYQDWAEFGAQLIYSPTERWTFKVGYSYEAFNTLYYNNKVLANATFNF
jgi:hypothetical protein